MEKLIPVQNLIYEFRGQKVMLDKDLAVLYGVATKVLNQSVKRNIERFPDDFMFQLSHEEWEAVKMRSQFVTSPKGGGRQYLPYAFTEQGISMLSSVLKSKQAIAVNIQIMRTFVKMRQFSLENKELAKRLSDVELYFRQYSKDNNAEIDKINQVLNYLLDITKPSEIGFKTK